MRRIKLFIDTLYPSMDGEHMRRWLYESAILSKSESQLASSPEKADAILFFSGHAGPDALRIGVILHPLYRRYRSKCFLYHDSDFAVPILPGLYPSLLAKDHRPGYAEGFPYYARQSVNQAVSEAAGRQPERRWLASFVGAANCEVRRNILAIRDPRVFVRDTTGRHSWQLGSEERHRYESEYAQVCAASRFILSPRGIGPSTYRQYEAWEIARCPVILSDAWVAPPEIPWESAALRLPETTAYDVGELLGRLEKVDDRQLGQNGREIHERWLTQEAAFPYIYRSIERLLDHGAKAPSPGQVLSAVAKSSHRRLFLGSVRRMGKERSWRKL